MKEDVSNKPFLTRAAESVSGELATVHIARLNRYGVQY